MRLPVHRIIPFANVDGLGNRTSIFVQGCNANCLYCHNPETIPMKSRESTLFSVEELVSVIKNSMPFIRGITVSGGEPTLYQHFLTELFKQVHDLGLTCYVDTNGFFNYNQLQNLIEQTDKFLFDIKGLGQSLEQLCFSGFLNQRVVLARNYQQRFVIGDEHFKNLAQLLQQDKIEEVRLVSIKHHYDEYGILEKIADLIKPYPKVCLKLIRVHTRGLPEERAIKLKGKEPSRAELTLLEEYARSLGLKNIIKII